MNPHSEGRRELDTLVINVELTLASIIQGVALFFLTDNARAVFTTRHWASFLYVAGGLCVIFIFWSRSIIHTLTLIRWPMEFGHNFFYIGCALGEAILFSRLDDPLAWFQLSTTYAAVVWLLFVYDMRLIHARVAESNNDADRALYARAEADQLLNIRVLVPLLFFVSLACALAVWIWPDLFITRGAHVWLISAQLVSFIVYLAYIGRHFSRIAQLFLQSRQANRQNRPVEPELMQSEYQGASVLVDYQGRGRRMRCRPEAEEFFVSGSEQNSKRQTRVLAGLQSVFGAALADPVLSLAR